MKINIRHWISFVKCSRHFQNNSLNIRYVSDIVIKSSTKIETFKPSVSKIKSNRRIESNITFKLE